MEIAEWWDGPPPDRGLEMVAQVFLGRVVIVLRSLTYVVLPGSGPDTEGNKEV